MTDVALITVTHDPHGRNIQLYKSLMDKLRGIYSELYITVSEFTQADLVTLLHRGNFNVKIIPKNGAAAARRKSLTFGLSGDSKFYHYCDFDRLLTWVDKYPEELISIVKEIPKHDYLILGRTERAFSTHPIEWVETEKISNKIFSLEIGKDVDITAGSCGFSRVSGELINKYSKDKMTDAEWPMIIYRIAKLKISYKPLEGLEYNDDINGYNNVLNHKDKWFTRLRLAYTISESTINTGKEKLYSNEEYIMENNINTDKNESDIELDFNKENKEFLHLIDSKKTMIFATSANNRVTARSISHIVINDKIYFQTDKTFLKYNQIIDNPKIALSIDNIQIEGVARFIGHPLSDENREFADKFKAIHYGSYENYSHMQDEVVVEVELRLVTLWKYIEGKPLRDFIDFKNERAHREYYDNSK